MLLFIEIRQRNHVAWLEVNQRDPATDETDGNTLDRVGQSYLS
jgi:hypothetical protein